jgi:peptidoglycan hydrolase CwlO-like protein
MLIESLILLFIIIIFYEIFNDVYKNNNTLYENFDSLDYSKLTQDNNNNIIKLQNNSKNQNKSITTIKDKLSKLNGDINMLNENVKSYSDESLKKYNEFTGGKEININDV